ncbi:MAG: hypothetical protein RJQ09_00785 [Cyclobacteriaceae bacterium]
MRHFLTLLIIISLPSLAISQSDIEVLRYLKEVQWPKAYKEQDTVLLSSILADEFQMITADGEWSTKKT